MRPVAELPRRDARDARITPRAASPLPRAGRAAPIAAALLVGCVGEAGSGCPWDRPCALHLDPPAASTPSILPVAAFDLPWFDAWYADDAGRVLRSASLAWGAWQPLGDTGLRGASPVAAWDPLAGALWVCRGLDGAVRCATSPDGAAWRELPPIAADRAALVWARAEGVGVLVAVDEGGRERLHRARYDGRTTWRLDPPLGYAAPGAWAIPLGDPFPEAWRLEGADGLATLAADGDAWRLDLHAEAAPSGRLAGATFYGQPEIWEVSP